MENIKIELTIDEANVVLAALGQQPYLKVADLINKIQGQGAAQLQQVPSKEVSVSQNSAKSTLVK